MSRRKKRGLAVSGPQLPGPIPGSEAKRETAHRPQVPSSRGSPACKDPGAQPAGCRTAGPWQGLAKGQAGQPGKGTRNEEEGPTKQRVGQKWGGGPGLEKDPEGWMRVPRRSQESNGENGVEMMGAPWPFGRAGPHPSAQSPRAPCSHPPARAALWA